MSFSQPSFVSPDHGINGHDVLIAGQTQHVFDNPVSYDPDVERVGQHDGRFRYFPNSSTCV